MWNWGLSLPVRYAPEFLLVVLVCSLGVLAIRVAVIVSLGALYGGAVGLPVGLPSVVSLLGKDSVFWFLTALLVLLSAAYGVVTVAQGSFEALAVKKTILSLSSRQIRTRPGSGEGKPENVIRVTRPFNLFLPVRILVSMVPSIAQAVIGIVVVFVISPPLGVLIFGFIIIGAAIARSAAKSNSKMTRFLSASSSSSHSEDDEEGVSGGIGAKLEKFIGSHDQAKIAKDFDIALIAWLESNEVSAWFELRKTWRQARIIGSGFAFAALVSVAVVPAILLEMGLVEGSVLNLAAIVGVVIAVAQAISSLSGSVAGLGRFHALLLEFRSDWISRGTHGPSAEQ